MNRRRVLACALMAGAQPFIPGMALARQAMPLRKIPSTGETLPIIGLGSTKPVTQLAADGPEPLQAVLTALRAEGGAVVDTGPTTAQNDAAFGRILRQPEFEGFFIAGKIQRAGKAEGLAQFRETQRLYGRPVDLLQIASLIELQTHWSTLKDLKAAGEVRYIGVTVATYDLYPALAAFLRRERPDFIQINYSISERRAEERLLPLAHDRGVAVLVNRPFMNGSYFERLKDVPVPDWAAQAGCESWPQFSLKYIMAHPAVTAILTETTKAAHMQQNARAVLGPQPDAATRARMVAYMDGL